MDRTKTERRASWISSRTGLLLPAGLIDLAEFLLARGAHSLDELELRPVGPLAALLAGEDAPLDWNDEWKVPFLAARRERDLPELFTFLEGSDGGLHWALVRDLPDRPTRGVARYYEYEPTPMEVDGGVLAAVQRHLAARLAGLADLTEDEPDEAEKYRDRLQRVQEFASAWRSCADASGTPLAEEREAGLASDTGLDAIGTGVIGGIGTWCQGMQAFADEDRLRVACHRALEECGAGQPAAALLMGRSIFYWGGPEVRESACVLLDRAYRALGHDAHARVLGAHFAAGRRSGAVETESASTAPRVTVADVPGRTGTLVVEVAGAPTSALAGELADLLARQIAAGANRLVLDCTGLEADAEPEAYMVLVPELLTQRTACVASGGDLVLTGVPRAMKTVLSTVLRGKVASYPDRREALARLHGE